MDFRIPRAQAAVTKYTAVCRKHWPENFNFKTVYGKLRLVNPPSIFPDVPKNCLATTFAQEQNARRTGFSARNTSRA